MACNSCSSNINGIIFPDFVSNSCCTPCCDDGSVGGINSGCGCHNCGSVGGTNSGCGCHNCGSVGGVNSGCGCRHCHRCCGNSNVSSGNCACSCGTNGCVGACD